jgi:Peptidase family M28
MRALHRSIPITLSLLGLFLATPVLAQYEGAEPPPPRATAGWDAIDVKTCSAWLRRLASKQFEGRGTGQRGYQRAAEYMAKQFKDMGLEPCGDENSYFQHVPFARITMEPKKSFLRVGKRGTKLGIKDGVTFEFGHGEVKGPLLVLRANGRDAKLQDPSVLDGQVVLLVGRQLLRSPLRDQIDASKALAVLTVTQRASRTPSREATRLVMATDLRMRARVSEAAARRILSASKLDPTLADTPKPGSVESKASEELIRFTIGGSRKDILVPNVIGKLPGSDPKLRDEVVILGSHLDHLGKRDKTIYYGADDDGSGSTALLATVKAFTSNQTRPRRSVVFLAVCGEEMGLLGSRYYTDHPIFPIEKTVAELQMDMVGRNEHDPPKDYAKDNVDTIHLVGSKRLSMELHEIILDCNRHLKFRFEYDQESVYTRSDHYNFAKKGIPVSFIFSGFHPDYHQPTDTVDKINFAKIVSTARLFYLVAFRVADQERRIRVDSGPLATDGASRGAEEGR